VTIGRSESGVSGSARAIPVELELHHWPLRDDPWRAWSWVAVVVAAGVAAGMVSGAVHLGALASLLVAATVWRDFFPVSYQLDPQAMTELTLFGRRQTTWASVSRYELRTYGVMLLPTIDKSPVARVHGRFLPWCGQQERVVELVDRYAQHARRVEL
jgi:hypothetical protein